MAAGPGQLDRLLDEVRACRKCVDDPDGVPLPHEPRPVLRVSVSAPICVTGQAPGTRVHASGVPFSDPSGVRLRDWMGVTAEEFYDVSRIAILPMGFCFPGHDAKGGDLPPRRECAAMWRERVLGLMPQVRLMLLVGQYAQRWHLEPGGSLSATVADWRVISANSRMPKMVPLPHPSWRNNAWLKKNPWFERELLPWLRREIRLHL